MKTKKIIHAAAGILMLASLDATTAQDFPVSFSGFLSHGYLKSSHYNYLANTEEGDFDFVEAGIKATWSPFDRTVVTGQAFAFELGNYGNYDLQLDYFFAD
ncbi:MAG: hypothetical protein AAGB46_19445 [Verrucomicrobiota bacterium]